MLNILLTGVATLDIINLLDCYPQEDSEVRATSQQIRSGGNAANSAIVMQQLGVNASLLAARADDVHAELVFSQLEQRHVNTSICPLQAGSVTPTSYICLSSQNASRTIVHYRELDELKAEHFTHLNLHNFDWLHFEARNCKQLAIMLEHAKKIGIPVSLELEKPRDNIDSLLTYADVLLISRPYATAMNFTSASSCIEHFAGLYSDKIISCTWGDSGAWAYYDGNIYHQPAFETQRVIETLAAGDTYNAALITSLASKQAIDIALEQACRLAAIKCQQQGLDNLIKTSF